MHVSKLLLASAACLSAPLMAQGEAPATTVASGIAKAAFDSADAAKAVAELAIALEENFVFPDKGKAYAAMLRANLAAKKYASFADAEEFATRVTADLQAIHKDGHLRLRPVTAEQRAQRQAPNGGPPAASTVAKAGWLGEGVAYIDLRGLPGNEATLADVRKFLAAHGECQESDHRRAPQRRRRTGRDEPDLRRDLCQADDAGDDGYPPRSRGEAWRHLWRRRSPDAQGQRSGDDHPARAFHDAGGRAGPAEDGQGLSADVEEDLFRGRASVAVAQAHAPRHADRRGDRRRRALRRDGADGCRLCRLHPGRADVRSRYRSELGRHRRCPRRRGARRPGARRGAAPRGGQRDSGNALAALR